MILLFIFQPVSACALNSDLDLQTNTQPKQLDTNTIDVITPKVNRLGKDQTSNWKLETGDYRQYASVREVISSR